MKLRTLFLLWWVVLVGCFAAIIATGCGEVTRIDTAHDADAEAEKGSTLPVDSSSSTPPPEVNVTFDAGDAREAGPSCAPAPSAPYCSSCRDARGVCWCGRLPCCDQHCQS
jgi:hypothetical protein